MKRLQINYNHVHNNLRLFDGWATSSFHQNWDEAWLLLTNWYIQVASQVAQRPKTYDLRKLENFRESSKLHKIIAKCSRNKNFVSTSKKLPKNRNWTFPVERYFIKKPVCLKYFVKDCRYLIWKNLDDLFVHVGTNDIANNAIFWKIRNFLGKFRRISIYTPSIFLDHR